MEGNLGFPSIYIYGKRNLHKILRVFLLHGIFALSIISMVLKMTNLQSLKTFHHGKLSMKM